MSKEGDGLRLTAAVTDGGLDLRAEGAPLPELTYTAETSAERVRETAEDTRESCEPATAGILESLKPVLSGAITILILVIIILIILKWQRQRKQDP